MRSIFTDEASLSDNIAVSFNGKVDPRFINQFPVVIFHKTYCVIYDTKQSLAVNYRRVARSSPFRAENDPDFFLVTLKNLLPGH
ncbi:hypothetical protein D3C85_1638450 [compost metagenome]